MIKLIVILYIVSLYISIPGLLSKAGIKFYYGLIPIYNIYLLFKVLNLNPILIIIFSLLMIICPFRELFATIFVIFLPFMVGEAYSGMLRYSFLSLILPFIGFPLIAYVIGVYQYGGDSIEFF